MSARAETRVRSAREVILKPLTRNAEYRRLPETIRQIEAAIDLSSHDLVARAQINVANDQAFLSPEALVFFVRRALAEHDGTTVADLMEVLIDRSLAPVAAGLKGFDEEERRDIIQTVLCRLTELLLADDDRSDFAQVRFWMVLKRIRLSACVEQRSFVARFDQLDEENDAAMACAPDGQLSPEEFAQLAEGLRALDPHLRRVFVMRHYQGWKIGPEPPDEEDPNDPSLAGYFGKSSRTIRNWLSKAEAALASFRRN
ncbi:RNA polymerase sigma factor [Sphingobium xanthum]|nr:hypothetical protein [Sphingobium xanthum]